MIIDMISKAAYCHEYSSPCCFPINYFQFKECNIVSEIGRGDSLKCIWPSGHDETTMYVHKYIINLHAIRHKNLF